MRVLRLSLRADDRASLRQALERRFNLEELETLAFDLGVDYNMLKHETTTQLSRELIDYFERRGNLRRLVIEALCKRDDEVFRQLSTTLPFDGPYRKVEVIIRSGVPYDPNRVRKDIAATIGIAVNEVVILGTALGSLRLLVSLPQEAADLLVRFEINDLFYGGNQVISLTSFDSLDAASQHAWRSIVRMNSEQPIPWKSMLESMNGTNQPLQSPEHLEHLHIIGGHGNSVIDTLQNGDRLVSQRLIWPSTEPLIIDAPSERTGILPGFLGIRQLSVRNRIYDVKPLAGHEPVQLQLHQKYRVFPLEGAAQDRLVLVREQAQPDHVGQVVVVSDSTQHRIWIDEVKSSDSFTHIHILGTERNWIIDDNALEYPDVTGPHIIGIVEAVLVPA